MGQLSGNVALRTSLGLSLRAKVAQTSGAFLTLKTSSL